MPKDSILMDKSELIKSKELEYVTFIVSIIYMINWIGIKHLAAIKIINSVII